MLQYPSSDFDSVKPLLKAMGSFWGELNRDPFIGSFFKDRLAQSYQTYINYLETIACLAHTTTPVFHKEQWSCLVLFKSKITQSRSSAVKYGAGLTYGQGYVYGQFTDDLYSADMSGDIVSASFIADRIFEPSFMLIEGTGFSIDLINNSLIFSKNPFDNVISRPVYDAAGNQVDEVITLWLCNSEFDINTLYRQWGYLVQTPGTSSEFYRSFISATFDAITGVASVFEITKLLMSAFGVTYASGDETVEDIKVLNSKLVIITDKNAYSFNKNSTAVVTIGQALQAGDQLVDTVEFIDITSDTKVEEVLNSGDWPALALNNSFISAELFSSLIFENKEVAVTWVSDDPVDVRFELKGWPADIDNFWQKVVAESSSGSNLANILDVREIKTTEPSSVNMPSTVNPMRLVLSNFLKNNMVLVKLKAELIDNVVMFSELFRNLRQHLPAHIALFIFMIFDCANDQYNMTDTVETVYACRGADTIAEEVDMTSDVESSMKIWLVKGCVA